MYAGDFEHRLNVWLEITKSSLKCGNAVGSARLHAIGMMIETSLEWDLEEEAQYRPLLKKLLYVCNFAKEMGTAAEKHIFMHIMIDMMIPVSNELSSQPPSRLIQSADELPDQWRLDFSYPAAPGAELGDIPF